MLCCSHQAENAAVALKYARRIRSFLADPTSAFLYRRFERNTFGAGNVIKRAEGTTQLGSNDSAWCALLSQLPNQFQIGGKSFIAGVFGRLDHEEISVIFRIIWRTSFSAIWRSEFRLDPGITGEPFRTASRVRHLMLTVSRQIILKMTPRRC